MTTTAITVTSVVAGDVVCSASDATDPSKVTKATPFALAVAGQALGVALQAGGAGTSITYADDGDPVDVGLGAPSSGLATTVIVNTSARAALKVAPDGGDYVLGVADAVHGYVTLQPRRHGGTFDVTDYGADPTGTVDSRAAFMAALAAAPTSIPTGQGLLTRTLRVPAGQYSISKPLVVSQNNTHIKGDGKITSCISGRSYVGPVILCTGAGSLTRNAADFAGGYSVSLDNNNYINLRRYGTAWDLDGKSAFCLEMICQFPVDQGNNSGTLLASGGSNTWPAGGTNAFLLELMGTAFGFTGTNLGMRCFVKTTNGQVFFDAPGAAIATGSHWYDIRIDYDGATLRMFIDGNLVSSRACTGAVVQAPWETVCLGWGLPLGYDGTDKATYVPTGMRLASMRLAHASRGSSNYAAHTTKFTEDATTKFLINFDVVDGPLHFARAYSTQAGMQDAWLPNLTEAFQGGLPVQIGGIVISDLYLDTLFGPLIDASATPNILVEHVHGQGQSGIIFSRDCYNSAIRGVHLTGYSWHGTGIRIGNSCNYVHLSDTDIGGFDVAVLAGAQLETSGYHYWKTSAYATLFVDQNSYSVHLKGKVFFTDEGGPANQPYGMVLLGSGIVLCQGVMFGLTVSASTRLVWINNQQPSGAVDQHSKITFEGCSFIGHPASPAHVLIEHTTVDDQIVFVNCDKNRDLVEYGVSGAAHVTVIPWESGIEHLVDNLPDSDSTLTLEHWLHGRLKLAGTLTAPRNLFVPAVDGYERRVYNATAQTITIRITGSTGVAIAAGKRARVSCNGMDIVRETPDT